MARKPNIIIIQTDQQSWSTLRFYGNPVLEAPALEALAERGVVFDSAYCNYPACAPSRSSMMTGRYASTIRNHANHMLIDPREVTLPGTLKAAGYRTALIGKNHAFFDGKRSYYPDAPAERATPVTAGPRDAGEGSGESYSELDRNFDYVFQGNHVSVDGMDADAELAAAIKHGREKSWGQQHSWSVNPYPAEKSVTHRLTDEGIAYIRGEIGGGATGDETRVDSDQPFFLWFSIPDPHTPYQVSEPYASMFGAATIPAPIHDSLEGKPERQKVAKYLDFNHSYDDDHFRQVRAIHYGMIRQIDDNLGRFFTELDAQGLTDDTIIVYLADHGDAMGDHGIIQKHNFFYDSFTRVPFVVSWPGTIEPRQTGELAELVDVMPTVLDLAGVDIPFGVQGASLAPFLTGKATGTKDHVVIESGEQGDPPELSEVLDENGEVMDKGTSFAWCAFREAWMGKGKAFRTKEWKLCLYANGEGELYDAKNDPDELDNCFGRESHAAVQAELTYRLALWQMDQDDAIPLNPTVGDRMHLRK